jgi:hypothetical protein
MTTDTPVPTETESTDKAAMLMAYDEHLAELTTFNFAKLEDFNAKMSSVEQLCEDPLGRAAIETAANQIRTAAFKDGKDNERQMIVVDQRFIDFMLDLRGVLAA